jgi:1,4-alpha-glucan branching enzyme
MKNCVSGLAHLLKKEPAMFEKQFESDGFEWLDLNNRSESVISFKRKSSQPNEELIIVLNMTPKERGNWKVNVPEQEIWVEIFNSDDVSYWGTGNYMNTVLLLPELVNNDAHYQLTLTLPPLAGIVLKRSS